MSTTTEERELAEARARLKDAEKAERKAAQKQRNLEARRREYAQKLQDVRDWAHRQLGVGFDGQRLTLEEQDELVALWGKASERTTSVGRPGRPLRLGRFTEDEYGRLSILIGKGVGEPDLLRELDEDVRLTRRIMELARRARGVDRAFVGVEPGSLLLPQWLFQWIGKPDPIVTLEQLGVLTFVLLQLENGRTVLRGARMEGLGGDPAERVLVVPMRSGAWSRFSFSGGVTAGLEEALRHLARNRVLTFEVVSSEWRIGYGSRLLKALRVAEEVTA
jgi:hypothetical protein